MKNSKLIVFLIIIAGLLMVGIASLYFFWLDKGIPPSKEMLPYDYPLVTVSEIMKTPQLYNGKNICLFGYYQTNLEGFDISVSPRTKDHGVWPDFANPSKAIKTDEKCTTGGDVQSCHSWLTICGLLSYSPDSFGGSFKNWDFLITETSIEEN